MNKATITAVIAFAGIMALPAEIPAKVIFWRAGREAAGQATRRGGQRMLGRLAAESPEAVAQITYRYGDDGLRVVNQHGRPAMRALLSSSDEVGAPMARMMQRHGDDAVRMAQSPAGRRILATENDAMIRAMSRTRGQAYPMLHQHGPRAARTLNQLSPQQSRQLMALHREGHFTAPQFEQILDVIGRHGGSALDFIWKHKGALAVTAVLVAFLNDPDPFITGAKDVTALLAGEVGKAASTTMTSVGSEIAGHINWNVLVGAVMAFIGLKWGVVTWWKSRRQQKAVEA